MFRMKASLLIVLLLAAAALQAEPWLPASDDEVLERVPPRDDRLGALRVALAERPDDLDLAVRIAREYVRAGRAEADPRYYGRAQAVLAPWWDAAEPPIEVLALRAQVRQSRHDFDGALADLDALLARNPRDAEAWFARAIVFEVRGEPLRAYESCLPLRRLADALAATACVASAAALGGRAEESHALLAAMVARESDADAATRAWALTTLAEIAERTGRDAEAEDHYRAALAVQTRDQYLLASFADFLLDRGRDGEVRALLQDHGRIEALLLRDAIAAARRRDADASRLVDTLAERFALLHARNETVHLGNEARFELVLRDDPRRALELARWNFEAQREPADLRILLEAALAAGEPEAAREALDWFEASGLEDARGAALAGRIEVALR
jgi:hypothetical protein